MFIDMGIFNFIFRFVRFLNNAQKQSGFTDTYRSPRQVETVRKRILELRTRQATTNSEGKAHTRINPKL